MYLSVILVTKNASIAVRTLHNLLNLNSCCMQSKMQIEINFVNDNPHEKVKLISKKLKTTDRILFIDYGVSIDNESLKRSLSTLEKGFSCIVFPGVTGNINWEMFKNKVHSGSTEPINQMGLDFDTEVSSKISEDNYRITKTNARAWAIDSKSIWKSLRDKKGNPIKIPLDNQDMFNKFMELNIKMYAFVAAQLCITYQHECISNILESSGVVKD